MNAKRSPSDNVSFLATTFTVPGGNGLPPLELNALTPLDYVERAIAARSDDPRTSSASPIPVGEGPDGTSGNASVNADGSTLDTLLHPLDALQGFAKDAIVMGAILLLALLLVAFGLYQITKE